MSAKNCIVLQSCSTGEYVYTRGTSSTFNEPFWEPLIGTVVQITDPANFPDIYYTVVSVCLSNDPPNTLCLDCLENTDEVFGVSPEYVTSTESEECPNTDAFVLLNCKADQTKVFPEGDTPDDINQSPETALVTSSDLTLYVGSVVHIEQHPGLCFQVLGPYSTGTGCPCDYYTVTNAFKDCECCLPPVPEVFVRTQQKPVKDFTRTLETECELRTIEKFAVNYYNYFREIKYGFENCCGDHDLDKLWMEMQLVKYNLMQNGTCTAPAEEVVVDCPISPLA